MPSGYTSLNEYNLQKYGCKVYKLSINAGFSCPNRDGTLGTRGCIFCSENGSGEFAASGNDILIQLENAKQRVEHKNKSGKYIAYFQSFTNTYAPTEILREKYLKAIQPAYIVGISIATRSDCLGKEVIDLLKEINKIKSVTVELGLQTANEQTAYFIRRGYKNDVYQKAVNDLKAAGIEVVTHIILGLPGETEADMLGTTRFAVEAGTDGVKFHTLYVTRGTDLAEEYQKGAFRCLELDEYADILKKCIALLPRRVVVHRITGDGKKGDLIAPKWTENKKMVLNFLNNALNH
ncbi:MAG: TIGR01212 family radical SAM protein [Clostridia bacterium]|nr:TIGR01212 family radical SAM protein [Clostridia bacterium]